MHDFTGLYVIALGFFIYAAAIHISDPLIRIAKALEKIAEGKSEGGQ